MENSRGTTVTHEDVIRGVVSAARSVHTIRISLPALTDRNSIQFMDWQDAFLDRCVRLSVAVERLDAFEREHPQAGKE